MLRPGSFEITDRAAHLAGFIKGQRILDVGCGDGTCVEHLEAEYGLDVHGIDISKVMIQKGLARNPRLRIQEGSAEMLDFPSKTFDGVLLECVLSVAFSQQEAIHEAYCVLKNGGKLILHDVYAKDPNPRDVEENRKKAIQHRNTKKEHGECEHMEKPPSEYCLNETLLIDALFALLEENGFKIMCWEDRTEDLKSFLAEGIMKFGSVEQFLKQMAPEGEDRQCFCGDYKNQKTGYFMLIAEKM